MVAYCRVYDSCRLQADCQEPGISSGILRSVIEYGLALPFLLRESFPFQDRILTPSNAKKAAFFLATLMQKNPPSFA